MRLTGSEWRGNGWRCGIAGGNDKIPVLRGAEGSGGSRAANPYDAPRKHGLSIAGGRGKRKGPAGPFPSSIDHAKPRKRVRGGRQHGAGAGGIVVHLADQGVHSVEFQLLADETDEGAVQRLSVKVALEVEQEDFQQGRAVVEGRP